MFGLLPIRPKVWIEGTSLLARTSLLAQLLCLFSYRKKMKADRADKTITIWARYLWIIWRKKIIPFDYIKRIYYAYGSSPLWWDVDSGTSEAVWFAVDLELYGNEEVRLFTFLGEEPSFVRLGDESLDFVDTLKEFTGKQLV